MHNDGAISDMFGTYQCRHLINRKHIISAYTTTTMINPLQREAYLKKMTKGSLIFFSNGSCALGRSMAAPVFDGVSLAADFAVSVTAAGSVSLSPLSSSSLLLFSAPSSVVFFASDGFFFLFFFRFNLWYE
jgi:hypothetical protein